MQANRSYVDCPHTSKRITYKDFANGARHYYAQCLDCGGRADHVRTADLSESDKATALPWDYDLERSGQAIERAKWAAEHDQSTAERNAAKEAEQTEWWARYEAHINSPKWRALRAKTLKRANYLCEGCAAARATEVHHLTYERLGTEMLFDLVAVCDWCHAKIHPHRS